MKNIFLLLLLLSSILHSQNKSLIKEVFYKQAINNIDSIALENDLGREKSVFISVYFKCNSDGDIFEVNVSDDSKIYEEEIKSFIFQIPQLNPKEYTHKGDVMKYDLKMRFKLASNKERKKITKNGDKIKIKYQWFVIKEHYPVKTIEIQEVNENVLTETEQIPTTESCKDLTDSEEIKKCVSREMVLHVNKKFDTDLAGGLTSGTYKVVVTFYISKKGEIVNVSAEADTPELIEEGIRVINSFPDFYQGGKINGKPVDVKYTFPIKFSIQ